MAIRSLLSLRWQDQSPTPCRTQERSLMAKFAPSTDVVDHSSKICYSAVETRRASSHSIYCDGKDLRTERLMDRKQELRRLLAKTSPPFPMRYADHVEGSGTALFQRVRELDLEGIVAKQKFGPYVTEREQSTWYKIRNTGYSQIVGREELFERDRHNEPVAGWHCCTLACAELEDAS